MLLKFLRKKKNMKRIMWALAILIIPAFVIWGSGTSDKKEKKGPDYAGKIFNRKVSFDEYLDMWQVARDNAIRSFGENIPPEFIDQLAWSRILLLEEAKRENITVKNEEVLERLVSFPAFQRNGAFDKKLYKSIVGEAARGFEERIRDDIAISKLSDKITSAISVTDEEIREEYRKKFEKIKASYGSVPFSDFEKDVSYQGPDLVKFYENNKNDFRKSEEVNIGYIEVTFSDFDKEVYVTEEQIKKYFEEHTTSYRKPDSEEAPVLDETIKKDISEKLAVQRKISLAEELAYKVLDKALEKKDLAETAAQFALKTKETGFFNIQQEIPGIGWSYEFTKKGFELKPGEISNMLIKGDNGFYIIKLKEKKKSYVQGFAEAKDAVIKSYIKHKSIELAEKKAKALYPALSAKIKDGVSFENAARESGLEPKQTDFVTRDSYIPMLGPAKDFVETSASLKDNELGGPLKTTESWVLLRLDGYEGIDEVKFAEEKEDFKEGLLVRKKQAVFDKWFQELRRKANFVSYTAE